ncbi:MAG: efflux RND transporter periplasmic adaptor subunit [Hyphomicrobiaceae bacterium]
MNRKLLGGLMLALAGGGLYIAYGSPRGSSTQPATQAQSSTAPTNATAPAVSVIKVTAADFVETVLITGSVVARDEILIAPEVEGLRVLELLADEGDAVTKGQVLARLSNDALQAQLAQNEANLARSDAAIAVARSTIVQAEATDKEAANAFERAKPLKQSGYVSGATYDQREAAASMAQSKLVAARDGLTSAMADKAALEAQRRELTWKNGRTEVRSPVDGRVSRRSARVGGVASASNDPMYRIIARGEVELDAELPESDVGKVREGQTAHVSVTGTGDVAGTVRQISSEVDRSTRLGKIKIFLGVNPALRLGAFGRGTIDTGKSRGLAVPPSAVVYTPDGPAVQIVTDGKVLTRAVKTGLKTQQLIEIVEGLADGETIVAKSGSFLRNGDAVRPIFAATNVSGAAP